MYRCRKAALNDVKEPVTPASRESYQYSAESLSRTGTAAHCWVSDICLNRHQCSKERIHSEASSALVPRNVSGVNDDGISGGMETGAVCRYTRCTDGATGTEACPNVGGKAGVVIVVGQVSVSNGALGTRRSAPLANSSSAELLPVLLVCEAAPSLRISSTSSELKTGGILVDLPKGTAEEIGSVKCTRAFDGCNVIGVYASKNCVSLTTNRCGGSCKTVVTGAVPENVSGA